MQPWDNSWSIQFGNGFKKPSNGLPYYSKYNTTEKEEEEENEGGKKKRETKNMRFLHLPF